jgi:MATE family multidrug resistance protein
MESQSAAAAPLFSDSELPLPEKRGGGGKIQERRLGLAKDVWVESRKLVEVVGPAVFVNLVFSTMNIVSQSFSGHLGDLELAAFSMANTVIDGFNFAMLVRTACIVIFSWLSSFFLGMVLFSRSKPIQR